VVHRLGGARGADLPVRPARVPSAEGGVMSGARVRVRLVFADRGSFHDLIVELPADVLGRYERIIDALREDAMITGELYVDTRRLVAAYRAEG
jgi:hypothetical protein